MTSATLDYILERSKEIQNLDHVFDSKIYTHMNINPQKHPDFERSQEYLLNFAKERHLILTEQHETRFKKANIPLLGAWCYPRTENIEKFHLCNKYLLWLWVVDDIFDTVEVTVENQIFISKLKKKIISIFKPLKYPNRNSPNHFDSDNKKINIVLSLTEELVEPLLRDSSIPVYWKRNFYDDIRYYILQGTPVIERRERRQKRANSNPLEPNTTTDDPSTTTNDLPSPQLDNERDMLKLFKLKREYDGAGYVVFNLIEYATNQYLTKESSKYKFVRKAKRCAAQHLVFLNDVLSFQREIVNNPDPMNLVVKLVHFHQCETIELATKKTIHLVNRLAKQLEACRNQFLQLLNKGNCQDQNLIDNQDAIGVYFDGLERWVRANLDWSLSSGRYLPNHLKNVSAGGYCHNVTDYGSLKKRNSFGAFLNTTQVLEN